MENQISTLHAALCDQLRAEQDEYVNMLMQESVTSILSHSWEYAAREDILHALLETELSDLQTMALLESAHPLEDLYNAWANKETDVMEQLWRSIEETSNAAWRNSLKQSIACKEAIEEAIHKHYHDNRLNSKAAVSEVVDVFGYDRVLLVLATTVNYKDWDARFSVKNKEWAGSVPVYNAPYYGCGNAVARYVVDKAHPGLVDLFLTTARTAYSTELERMRNDHV